MKKLILVLTGLLCTHNQAWAQNPPSFADLAEIAMPSVVNISTTPNEMLPDVESFNSEKTSEALGSGFIIDEKGFIVTNMHVIDKAKSIDVILADNSRHEAKLIGYDKKTDVALIKITTDKKLTPAKLGDSEKIRVGEWVLAIGNPFGLGGSVSAGIISAKSRDIESGPYDNFLQTDAAINQGSSGGPMFNMQGEVIGINTAIFSTNGTSMGVGFAIPTHIAKFVIEQLKATGSVKRGWIGIKIQPNTADIAKSLNISSNLGVLVSGLTDNAPAQKAGIMAGDVILRFDGKDVDNTKNFSRMIAEMKVGKKVLAEIWRKDAPVSLDITIGEMPDDEIKVTKPIDSSEETVTEVDVVDNFIPEVGLRLHDVNPANMEKYRLTPDVKGMVVTEVEANSDAALKGIKAGDVVVKIDNKDILDFSDAKEFISDAKRENNRPVLLFVQTPEIIHFVAVKLR